MDKKNQVLLTVIAVATLLVAVVGATFAYFSAKVTETNKTQTRLKSAELGITFTGTQEITTECNNGTAGSGENTYNCSNGGSWEPGSHGTKKFTVENTSDYDMTFDINLTNVVNNFSRPQDLTYSMTAKYTDVSENTSGDYTLASKVQMVTAGSGVASSTKADFLIPTGVGNDTVRTMPKEGSVVYPKIIVDGEETEDEDTTQEPTITPGNNVTQIVRVFIPAHTTEEFEMLVTYVDAYETVDDEEVGVDQNADQGKIFRATVNITANGIDAGTSRD